MYTFVLLTLIVFKLLNLFTFCKILLGYLHNKELQPYNSQSRLHKISFACFLVINPWSSNVHKIKCAGFKCIDECVVTNICLYLSTKSIKIQTFSVISQIPPMTTEAYHPRQPRIWYFSVNLSSACSGLNINWKNTVHILLCVRLLF